MNLLLFGFKGSGKTHFGKRLAREIDRPFIDTDDLILELYLNEQKKQCQLGEIYRSLGEEGFRSLESRALQRVQNAKASIIAVGGGAVLKEENVRLLKSIGTLVFLKASREKLKERIFKEELPSFLDPKDPEGSFDRMLHARDPIYRSIQAPIIDTDLLDEQEVLATLKSIGIHGF